MDGTPTFVDLVSAGLVFELAVRSPALELNLARLPAVASKVGVSRTRNAVSDKKWVFCVDETAYVGNMSQLKICDDAKTCVSSARDMRLICECDLD